MALDMSVEHGLGPKNLPAGLTGILGAEVDLVVDGHVPDLAVVAHYGTTEVAHKLLLPIEPHLSRDLWHLHIRLALGKTM